MYHSLQSTRFPPAGGVATTSSSSGLHYTGERQPVPTPAFQLLPLVRERCDRARACAQGRRRAHRCDQALARGELRSEQGLQCGLQAYPGVSPQEARGGLSLRPLTSSARTASLQLDVNANAPSESGTMSWPSIAFDSLRPEELDATYPSLLVARCRPATLRIAGRRCCPRRCLPSTHSSRKTSSDGIQIRRIRRTDSSRSSMRGLRSGTTSIPSPADLEEVRAIRS